MVDHNDIAATIFIGGILLIASGIAVQRFFNRNNEHPYGWQRNDGNLAEADVAEAEVQLVEAQAHVVEAEVQLVEAQAAAGLTRGRKSKKQGKSKKQRKIK